MIGNTVSQTLPPLHLALFELPPMLTAGAVADLAGEVTRARSEGANAGLLVVSGDWQRDLFGLAMLEVVLEFSFPGRFAVVIDGEIPAELARVVWLRVGPVFVTSAAIAGELNAIPDEAPLEFAHEALAVVLAARPEASRKALGQLLRHGRMTGPGLAAAGLAELVDDIEQARERFARQLAPQQGA